MFVLIEDDSRDLALAASVLSRMGARGSTVFGDSYRAIEHFHAIRRGEEMRPEAVIVDLALRRGSGQELMVELKKYPELADLPIIVWTRTSDHTQKEICFNLGAVAVLQKSKNAQELREAVMDLRRGPHSVEN